MICQPKSPDGRAEFQVVSSPIHHWVYALPGTHLHGLRSAGSPSLEALATMPDDHGYGLAGDDAASWRGWVLYGPPDQALQELCAQSDDHAIATWAEQLLLASRVKRRWRDRLVLINLEGQDGAGDQPSALEDLQQALPELELEERLKRRSNPAAGTNPITTLAALALLQSDAALLQAYLDLETWADVPAAPEQCSSWRIKPSHSLLLQALRSVHQLERTTAQNKAELEVLMAERQRVQRERACLQHTVEQLEAELEHYVAEHLSLNTITRRLEEQLLRARRWIQASQETAAVKPPAPQLR